jgi:hypothetical protein
MTHEVEDVYNIVANVDLGYFTGAQILPHLLRYNRIDSMCVDHSSCRDFEVRSQLSDVEDTVIVVIFLMLYADFNRSTILALVISCIVINITSQILCVACSVTIVDFWEQYTPLPPPAGCTDFDTLSACKCAYFGS